MGVFAPNALVNGFEPIATSDDTEGLAVTDQKKDFPDFYITAPQPCPYLPSKVERKLFTHLTNDKPTQIIDNLLRRGFRRSQNIAYMPYCDNCAACVPVRIVVDAFERKRTMERTWRRNWDLVARRVSAEYSSAHYDLFRSYIDARHGDGGMADMTVRDYQLMVEDSMVDTFLTEYRLRPENGLDSAYDLGPVVGVSLCDRLSDGISLVYSFYDPELTDRGLGTYMILEHVEYARRLGLPYIYLGYWIAGSQKMAYKERFTPQEHLIGQQGWIRVPG